MHIVEEKPAQQYGGVAFNAGGNQQYLANLPPHRMTPSSVFPQPLEQWLRNALQRGVPRPTIQAYVQDQFAQICAQQHLDPQDLQITGTVEDIEIVPDAEQPVRLIMQQGDHRDVTHAVLATGHRLLHNPPFFSSIKGDPRFIDDIYAPGARDAIRHIPVTDSVLIVGTGMRAVDAIQTLADRTGFRADTPPIVAISRHGHMHAAYRTGYPGFNFGSIPEPEFLQATSLEVLKLGIVQEYKQLTRQSRHAPESILAAWERGIPEVIQNLQAHGVTEEEIAAALKEHQSLIATRRISMAPAAGDLIDDLQTSGRLQVWPATITDMLPEEVGISVAYTMRLPNGNTSRGFGNFDYVISALGYNQDYNNTTDPLWRNLINKGMAVPHPAGGVRVTDDGALIDQEGNASPLLSVVGVPRSGQAIFAGHLQPTNMAIPTIMQQVEALAERVLEITAQR